VAIAENLKQHRKNLKWSQKELADHAGISQAQISHIESGERTNPGVVTIKKLADALGVSVEQIIK
jgi:transcriptional regulator with XRE-family HTH domain